MSRRHLVEADVARQVLRAYEAWALQRARVAELSDGGIGSRDRDLQCFAFARLVADLGHAVAAVDVQPLFDALHNHGADVDELEELEGIYAEMSVGEPPRCRMCGCTEVRACPGGCSWVSWDLCSSCTDWGWGALSA